MLLIVITIIAIWSIHYNKLLTTIERKWTPLFLDKENHAERDQVLCRSFRMKEPAYLITQSGFFLLSGNILRADSSAFLFSWLWSCYWVLANTVWEKWRVPLPDLTHSNNPCSVFHASFPFTINFGPHLRELQNYKTDEPGNLNHCLEDSH